MASEHSLEVDGTAQIGKNAWIMAAILSFVFFLAAVFYFTVLPAGHSLLVVPEILSMLVFMPPLFLWQTLVGRQRALKIAMVASLAIWLAGLLAGFLIPPASSFIYLPDGLLLIGFLPLLYCWRYSWTWLIYGILNIIIGFLLLLIGMISDAYFPAALWPAKHHLALYHPAFTWMLLGLVSCIFGFVRLIKNLCLWLRRRTG